MRPVVHIQPIEITGARQDSVPDIGVLSADEHARGKRFAQGPDRYRFVVGRTLMRRVLGILTQTAPMAVAITLGPRGKPVLTAGKPHFNLSHGGAVLALAWCRESAVGIDVETPVAMDTKLDVIARGALTGEERMRATTLTDDARAAFLMRSWTLKEAVAKAHGGGLSVLKRFCLEIPENNTPPYIAAGDLGTAPDRWHLFEFRIGDAHGAVASVGTARRPEFVVHASATDLDVMDGGCLPGVTA
jgi:4'-phosphopantetheinyl transferase